VGNGVKVPSFVYKIIIDQQRQRSIAFLFPNVKLDPKMIEGYVVSIGEIEDYTGINFSPALPPNLNALEKNRGIFRDW
jgi:DNA/RNA endonuclease G (NUC1)